MATQRILTINPAGTVPQASAATLATQNGTQATVALSVATANSGLVLAPNGTGALLAQQPDATAVAGNARGQYATDWQRQHGGDAARVASGTYATVSGGLANQASSLYSTAGGGYANRAIGESSVIPGGYVCTIGAGAPYGVVGGGQINAADGNRSVVAGGQENYAFGSYSCSPGGFLGFARLRNEFAFAGGGFAGSAVGQAQTSMFNLRKAWVNSNAGTTQELFLDGGFNTTSGQPLGSERITLPNETVPNNTRQLATFIIETAVINTVTGASYCTIHRGAIKNFQGTVAFVGTVAQEVYADGGLTWSVTPAVVLTGTTRGLALNVSTNGNTNWIKAHATVMMTYINAFRGTLFP
jgi:hypothetical protein